jgi:hypothetical protein
MKAYLFMVYIVSWDLFLIKVHVITLMQHVNLLDIINNAIISITMSAFHYHKDANGINRIVLIDPVLVN